MHTVPIRTARQAAELIRDGAVLSISSSSGLGCPDATLRGIGDRFAETGHPRNLTTVHPIAAGDMYGIKGIDHLAKPGLLARTIAGSYPSGPSRQEPPLIWQMIERGEVEAYNLPSGILFQMHRAGAAKQPGVYSPVGLGTFIDPRQQGGRMNSATTTDIVEVAEVRGREYLFYPAVEPDVAIIRATTADCHGNLTFEHEGSTLGTLDQAYAAHNRGGLVIAQVKRVLDGAPLPPQSVRVPGILVDALVIDPEQFQTTQTLYDPTLSGEERCDTKTLDVASWGLDKVIARRSARELLPGETVNLGFGVSALIPRILVEEGQSGDVTWVIEQGAVGGVPLTGFAFGCAVNPEALMPSIDQFTLLQGGGFDHAMLSFLQVDRHGNVNVHDLPGRRHVTAGVGGFADITSAAKSIVFSGFFNAGHKELQVDASGLKIVSDGAVPKFVENVSAITFSGRRALESGQRVSYVTERCVIELRDEGLTVTEYAPGIDLRRDVLDRAEFPLLVADDARSMDIALFQPGLVGSALHVGSAA